MATGQALANTFQSKFRNHIICRLQLEILKRILLMELCCIVSTVMAELIFTLSWAPLQTEPKLSSTAVDFTT